MIQSLALLFPLILTNNLIMSLVKWLAAGTMSNVYLRILLVAISIIGVIGSSAVTGNPVDFNQVSNLGALFIQVVVLAIGSHFSFKAISNAPASQIG